MNLNFQENVYQKKSDASEIKEKLANLKVCFFLEM